MLDLRSMSSGGGDAPVWAPAARPTAPDAEPSTSSLPVLASFPDWLTLREGTRPLVLVAPHGGRRRRDVRRGDNVNDLHTAELTWELAERLDAHAIINHGLDRNDVDLNRISHLSGRAPQVLALLRAAVEHAGGGDQAALVLFVHGWNMVLPCCDIGIGLRRRDGAAVRAEFAARRDGAAVHAEFAARRDGAAVHAEFAARRGERGDMRLSGRFPTVSRGVYESAVAGIERALASRGISAAIGRRYSASGRDNAAQLFSGRHVEHAHDDVAALARLAADGRVDGVQLELGIALRWPGPLRDAFIDGLVEALAEPLVELPAGSRRRTDAAEPGADRGVGAPGPDADLGVAAAVARASEPRVSNGWTLHRDDDGRDAHALPAEPGYALQAVLDAQGETGLFAGVEATGPHSMAGRFCLVLADGSMMLLVGEGPWNGEAGNYSLEGFRWNAARSGALDIELEAPVIRYRRHDAYLDLEEGLASADLLDARVRLRFELEPDGVGRLRGRIDAGERSIAVDAVAFLERGGRRASAIEPALPPDGRVRVMVGSPSGAGLRLQSDLAGHGWLEIDAPTAATAPLGCIRARRDDPESGGFEEASIVARVPVWRSGPGGVLTRWTFGIVRCRFKTEPGVPVMERPGVFELLEVIKEA